MCMNIPLMSCSDDDGIMLDVIHKGFDTMYDIDGDRSVGDW